VKKKSIGVEQRFKKLVGLKKKRNVGVKVRA